MLSARRERSSRFYFSSLYFEKVGPNCKNRANPKRQRLKPSRKRKPNATVNRDAPRPRAYSSSLQPFLHVNVARVHKRAITVSPQAGALEALADARILRVAKRVLLDHDYLELGRVDVA